ncbi:hypothetical protein GCM10025853_27690 [Tetragenococcus halophilus subsp. halophilus DSM 20339]|nr:hypothetical protein GCM10025853_27690 [Tetragenococcus halophilus subsp. halophilus DSM 20339]
MRRDGNELLSAGKKDVLDQLNVDKSGLSQQEVKRRQETEGFNEIEKEKRNPYWRYFSTPLKTQWWLFF